jgi:glycosyltransferase involved in cell wall biosynthesis
MRHTGIGLDCFSPIVEKPRTQLMPYKAQPSTQPLRILVIADSKIPVPPKGYGGAERIIAYLCEGFARRGHDVTLMAAEGSQNFGRLIAYPWSGRRSLLWRGYCKLYFLVSSLGELTARHDVVIACCRPSYLTPFLRAGIPLLYRFGNPIDADDVRYLTSLSNGPLSLVAVSNQQRSRITSGDWHTIYNGVDIPRTAVSNPPACSYLAFIGRLTANKGVDAAIRIAKRTGHPLKIAGNISDEPGDREFFDREIAPHLRGNIEWIGEIGDDTKFEFLASANALLAPIHWDEPCANVVMEALACGTPVITTRRGCMPELVRNGVTGFLATDENEMAYAVARIGEIAREACRREAETRFSCDGMVDEYLNVVHALIDKKCRASGWYSARSIHSETSGR